MTEYPVLHSLVRYYFDQDYDIRGDTIAEVIDYFLKDNPRATSIKLASELRNFLASQTNEDDATLTRVFEDTFKPDLAFHQWERRTTRENLEYILHIVET